MNDKIMFLVMFTGIFCLVGGIFIGIGYFLKKRQKTKEERCTSQVWGTIMEIVHHRSTHNKGVSYFPVYEYNTGFEKVTVESHVGSSRLPYQVGNHVKVYYDPSNVRCSYIGGDKTNSFVSTVFIAMGSLFMVIGIVVGFIVLLG